jgi:hypothetical protein
MPVIGTLAGASARGLGGLRTFGAALTNSFESIATHTVTSAGTSTITFSNIPGTYKHLHIRGIALVTVASESVDVAARFNSDTGSNYAEHYVYGSGNNNVVANGQSGITKIAQFYAYDDSSSTVDFAPGVFEILDYASTDKFKVVRGFTGPADENLVVYRSSVWRSTSAITSITFTTTGTFKENSRIALYGIKGVA